MSYDPIDQEAARVVDEQVAWWEERFWSPRDGAKALGIPYTSRLSWPDIQRKMRLIWLEFNGICTARGLMVSL